MNEMNRLLRPTKLYIKLPDAKMMPKAFSRKSSIPEDSCFAALISPNSESYDGGASVAVFKAKKFRNIDKITHFEERMNREISKNGQEIHLSSSYTYISYW